MRRHAANHTALLATLLLALPLAVLPHAAQAKSSDRNQPMDVEADRTDAMMTDDSDSTLSGNVRITQGSLEINSDIAIIQRRGGDISRVTLVGAPAQLKQVGDNGEPMTAQARQIVYTLSDDVIVLTGGVVIDKPRGTLRGETIKYDTRSGRLDGGGDGRRVSMRILPKTAAPKPAGSGD